MSGNPYESPKVDKVSVAPPQRASYRKLWWWLGMIASVVLVIALLVPAVRTAPEAARRVACRNHLHQIGIALYKYKEEYGCLPPAYTVDANGRPLHSWRTLLLPYLGYEGLYRQIDLSKPWDHPDNRKALKTEVDVYHCPSVEDTTPGYTTYLAIVSDKSCLQPGKPRKLSEIDDPLHLTIVVVDVGPPNAVPWMSPRDASEDLVLGMLKSHTTPHPGVIQVLFVDGSVHCIGQNVNPRTWRALMTATGHDDEVIDPDTF